MGENNFISSLIAIFKPILPPVFKKFNQIFTLRWSSWSVFEISRYFLRQYNHRVMHRFIKFLSIYTGKITVGGNLGKLHSHFYTPKNQQGVNHKHIKKHRSDTDLLYLLGAEIAVLFGCTVTHKSCYGGFRLRRLMDWWLIIALLFLDDSYLYL